MAATAALALPLSAQAAGVGGLLGLPRLPGGGSQGGAGSVTGDDAGPSPDEQAAALLVPPALSNPVSVVIDAKHTTLALSTAHDYTVRIAPGAVLTRGVRILGGHNVVLMPGVLSYVRPAGSSVNWVTRGLYLKGQSGTMYVSGLTIQGPLNEGIDLDQRLRGAAVVLKGISIGRIVGSYKGHHADLLQTWAGPSKLVVSGFQGTSNYQGMFLLPNQRWKHGPHPQFFYLRDVQLDMRTGYYAFWTVGHHAFPLYVRNNVDVQPNPVDTSRDAWLWPKPSTGDTSWSAVRSE
jgi:hypothetical protein